MTYSLAHVPHISGGAGTLAGIGAATRQIARSRQVLVIADPGLRSSGLPDRVAGLLTEAAMLPELFFDFTPDPKAGEADAAIGVLRDLNAGAVLALGGGSALDLGKAVGALADADAPVEAFALMARDLPATGLPVVAIPTTAGTGAEITRTAVLTSADHSKAWYWGASLKPDHVILDPEVTVSLPAGLTASTGIDALVHALEAATNRNAHAANDMYAHEAIRLVSRHFVDAVADGGDLSARDGMQRAAALAGIAIDNCGTAIAHAIGHALGSLRPIHHGRAVALGMLATLRWNIESDDGRYDRAARALGLGSAGDLPVSFEGLLRRAGIDIGLGGAFADVTPSMLARQIRRPENIDMCRSNHRPVSDNDLEAFSEIVLSQH